MGAARDRCRFGFIQVQGEKVSFKFRTLDAILQFVEEPRPFILSADAQELLNQEHNHLLWLVSSGHRVYGVNTSVGHKDHMSVETSTLWAQVVESHHIGAGDPYSAYQARCIGFAKIAQWAAGKSGVSPSLFKHVSMVMGDPSFAPSIPSGQSYSSGDVIPATHWAVSVLNGTPKTGGFVGDAETMPLINGSFVHVGLAASSISATRQAVALWHSTTQKFLTYGCRNNTQVHYENLQSMDSEEWALALEPDCPPWVGPQDSVSIRASVDVGRSLNAAMEHVCEQIDLALTRPSGNPLFDQRIPAPISQASFLAPSLVISQSALIEAVLLAMWTSVSRTQYLLSGALSGVPEDGSSIGLGLIQKPKQMLAILEHARLKAGRRVFASGASASQGIEDLWTQGVFVSELLIELIKMFGDLSTIEASIIVQVKPT